MTASPDAVGLQVRDVERSADFYRRHFGFDSDPSAPPGVVLFKTDTIPFLIREPRPGTDLEAGPVGMVSAFRCGSIMPNRCVIE